MNVAVPVTFSLQHRSTLIPRSEFALAVVLVDIELFRCRC